MARRRYGRRHRRHSFKIPVLTLAILGGQGALAMAEAGGANLGALNVFQSYYTGIDISAGHPVWDNLYKGWAPWLVKGLVTRVARPLGATPRIPFGLPISLS